MYYLLEDDKPVIVSQERFLKEYYKDRKKNVIRRTKIKDVKISTVFLGIDHSTDYCKNAKPLLFETMVFGGDLDLEMERYETKKEAIIGHKKIVEKVKGYKYE